MNRKKTIAGIVEREKSAMVGEENDASIRLSFGRTILLNTEPDVGGI